MVDAHWIEQITYATFAVMNYAFNILSYIIQSFYWIT